MEYKNYVNGEWIETENKLDIHSIIDNSILGTVNLASKEQVDEAFYGARKVQKDWKDISISKKSIIFSRVCEILESKKEKLINLLVNEIGKDFVSAQSEINRSIEFINFTMKEAGSLTGEVYKGGNYSDTSNNKLAMSYREPIGVVLAISPFNYPINLAISKIVPALIMGNTVVLKPATRGCIAGIELAKIFEEAGLPKGVFSVLVCRGSEIGDYIVTHKEVDLINFTGSTQIGDKIAKITGRVPLIMELGGKDSAIVLEDADLDKTAKCIVNGAFSYSGQRCTAIKRVIVINKIADELVRLLVSYISNIDDSTICPLIDNKSADYIEELINESKKEGAKLLVGGIRKGNLIKVTLFDNVTRDMRLAWEEPFGPILPIIRVNSIEEAVSLSNESEYGLQASIFTTDINNAFNIASKLEVGTVQINNKTERGPDNFPFLGVKASGTGVQGIRESLLSMSRPKVVVINL
ncbi:MAG: aldehyde dehydrogenase family protein [Clostridium sp.]|nr:aldehyde dehydrogenase family protein [Clostridium sp.]